MKHIIHIFGASGSGTSTLGQYISSRLGYRWMDSDDYFWLPTNPRFTVKRALPERIQLMRRDIDQSDNVVISGSLADWGNELIPCFTLAIRLVTDTEERIRRIREREYKRFGDRIKPGGDMYEQHEAFVRWASEYDIGDLSIRSRKRHDEWQKRLDCRLLTLNGKDSPEENLKQILDACQKVETNRNLP